MTGEVFTLHATLALLFLLLLVALTPVLTKDAATRAILPIVGVYYVFYTVTPDWALQAQQRMTAVGLVRLAGQLVVGAVAPFVVVGGLAGAQRYAWLTVLGAAMTAGLALVLVCRQTGLPALPQSGSALAERLRRSAPIGFSIVMVHVYYSVDQILLGYLKGTEDVGQYAAATKIPFVLIGFAVLWSTVIYPHAARVFERDPRELRRQLGIFASLSLAAALPLVVGGTLMARDLMVAIFGNAYSGAAGPFTVLLWSTAIVLVSVNLTQVLLASGGERFLAWSVAAGAALNVALNFALIPSMGPTGAAIATVAAETVVFGINAHRVSALLGRPRLERRRLGGIAAATAVMAVVVVVLPGDVSVWVRLGVATGIYGSCSLVFGAVRHTDAAILRARD